KGLKGPTLYKAPTLPAWTWTVLYLGVNVGYGWGKSSTDTMFSDATTGAPLLATITSATLKGMIFGGQAGFNWQSGPVGRGSRRGRPAVTTAWAGNDVQLRRRDLQSGSQCLWVRCASDRKHGAETGMVQNAARASWQNSHA